MTSMRGRVLLAEDTPELRRLLSVTLMKAGFEVTVAETGREAIVAARRAREKGASFDLIFMDMQMPDMGGEEATTLLRSDGESARIVALTANALAGDRDHFLAIGCDDYIAKPVTRDVLLGVARASVAQSHSAEGAPIVSLLAGDEATEDLVDAFVERLPQRLAALQRFIAARDRAGGARAAHQLKGAAGSFGFPAIMEIAGRLERVLLREGDDPNPHLAALLALSERIALRE